jgi:hypothetical protein
MGARSIVSERPLPQADQKPPKGLEAFHALGPLSWVTERFFWLLQYFTLAFLLRIAFRVTVQGEGDVPWATTKRRARFVEQYIIVWLALEILAALVVPGAERPALRWACRVVVCARIIEIIQVAVNINAFDHIRLAPGKHGVSSLVRALLLSVFNYFELALAFGVPYASVPGLLTHATSVWTPYYFSVVTQLTVGYGDVAPLGVARVLATAQAIAGTLFLVIMLGRFVGLLPEITADVEKR